MKAKIKQTIKQVLDNYVLRPVLIGTTAFHVGCKPQESPKIEDYSYQSKNAIRAVQVKDFDGYIHKIWRETSGDTLDYVYSGYFNESPDRLWYYNANRIDSTSKDKGRFKRALSQEELDLLTRIEQNTRRYFFVRDSIDYEMRNKNN